MVEGYYINQQKEGAYMLKNTFCGKCRWICLIVFMMSVLSFSVCSAEEREAPLYELYPTGNFYTFLKLNTKTGAISQIQYSINDDEERFEVVVNGDMEFASMSNVGRFKLYPTQNMYNFLLLDQKTGLVRQVQWSTKPENRGIVGVILPI